MKRSPRGMWIPVVLTIALVNGCGTYSLLRGADNLKAGEFEMTAGITANSLPEVLGVAQLAVGITDWMEFGAQYEFYSALGQLRFGIINSEDHGFAISLGIGGGMASIFESLDDEGDQYIDNGAILGSITLGRRWDWFELYLGYKSLFLMPLEYSLNTVKLGVRFTFFGHLVLGIEGGATFHHAFWTLAEGAAHIGFKI